MEDEENQGSLLLGLALGYFLGCIGVVVAFVLQGSKTLTGSVVGMVLQWISVVCLGVVLGVVNALLMNSY